MQRVATVYWVVSKTVMKSYHLKWDLSNKKEARVGSIPCVRKSEQHLWFVMRSNRWAGACLHSAFRPQKRDRIALILMDSNWKALNKRVPWFHLNYTKITLNGTWPPGQSALVLRWTYKSFDGTLNSRLAVYQAKPFRSGWRLKMTLTVWLATWTSRAEAQTAAELTNGESGTIVPNAQPCHSPWILWSFFPNSLLGLS